MSLGTASNIVASGTGITSISFTNSTLTAGYQSPYLVVNKRDTGNIMFPTWDTEFIENSVTYSSTGSNQLYELQVPGSYTHIGLQGVNNSNAGVDLSGGSFTLQYLSNTLRQFTASDIQVEEQYSQGNDGFFPNSVTTTGTPLTNLNYFPGYSCLDFIHDGFGMETGELGSVLNANQLAGSGARIQLLQNICTAGTYYYTWQRIFGDLTPLKLSAQLQNAYQGAFNLWPLNSQAHSGTPMP